MELFDRISMLGRIAGLCALLLLLPLAQAQSPAVTADSIAIDYSYAGYGAGQALPKVRAQVRVAPSGHDDTTQIQQALDSVASRPIGQEGFRGAVVLAAGRFHVQGQLLMRASGVVLRGAGPRQTFVIAEGNSRRALVEVGGTTNSLAGKSTAVIDDAPAGSISLHLASVEGLKPGASVMVTRPSTAEWISQIGMTNLPGNFASIRLDWKPGSRDLVWDRTIVTVDAQHNRVTLDAPITMALEKTWGGGTLVLVESEQLPERIGIENLALESSYDASNPADEEHAWIAILIDHTRDAWVRQVTARHFVSSAVRVNSRARRITVVDCESLEPIAEKAGYRRQSFVVNGQQVLVARCLGVEGMNDFASGMLAAGPNVFFNCAARKTLGASGAFESMSAGLLYEQVHVPEARIQLVEDFSRAQAAGWTSANSLIWNSTAKTLDALGVPGAPNRVVESREPLFAAQLKKRTGRSMEQILGHPFVSFTEDAQAPLFHASAATVAAREKAATPEPVKKLEITGGRFVVDGQTGWGASQTEARGRETSRLFRLPMGVDRA